MVFGHFGDDDAIGCWVWVVYAGLRELFGRFQAILPVFFAEFTPKLSIFARIATADDQSRVFRG